MYLSDPNEDTILKKKNFQAQRLNQKHISVVYSSCTFSLLHNCLYLADIFDVVRIIKP